MAHEGALLSTIRVYSLADLQAEHNILLQLVISEYPKVRNALALLNNLKPLLDTIIDKLLENPTQQFVIE